MMRGYSSPAAFRTAVEARLGNRAAAEGIDVGRLRRQLVFERILVRVELGDPGVWILKGGMALELRLGMRARATRDLDLATRAAVVDGEALRELLVPLLANDPDGDGFSFRVGPAKEISADEAGRPGWRLSVEAVLAGRTFAAVLLDVVARPEELAATERITLPNALSFAGAPAHDAEAVAPAQVFAEKLHALTRTYGERENTRVRDPVPESIPDPPDSWRERFTANTDELELQASDVYEALDLVRRFWSEATANGRTR